MSGHFLLLLHAHLPFVRHPEDENFLEEDWFYEAVTEVYLPLLRVFYRLAEDRVPFRLALSLSPTLLAMLGDSILLARYERRLGALIEWAKQEERNASPGARATVARFYATHLEGLRQLFVDTFRRDLIRAFASLQAEGHLELLTTSATHAFLPLLQNSPSSVRAQIRMARQAFKNHFGSTSRGMWLPECGYYSSLDAVLAQERVRYFCLDSKGFTRSTPAPVYGVHAPIVTKQGVVALGRDVATSQQVWNAHVGFPGHPSYREFYRDAGFEKDSTGVYPLSLSNGRPRATGLKLHRITGKTEEKAWYVPELAMAQAQLDAKAFFQARSLQFERLKDISRDFGPILFAPFDAELFGHWWFEGPMFLEAFFRECAQSRHFRLETPSECLRQWNEFQVCEPHFSSWGHQGYADMWLNERTYGVYAPLLRCAERMESWARSTEMNSDALTTRALNQAARELLLAQSSDWAFMITSETSVEYAKRRLEMHTENFLKLDDQLQRRELNVSWLLRLENQNNIFPDLNFRIFGETGESP